MSTQPQTQTANLRQNGTEPLQSGGDQTTVTNNTPSNVRHIPIYVEGRDEPIVNKHSIETKTTSTNRHPSSDGPTKAGTLFDRVKNFPTKKFASSTVPRRNDSPNRTIPIHVQHSASTTNGLQSRPPSKMPAENCSILKIQNIQKDVLELMDLVEKFNGTSRKDKQYLYLDEMLTQNLLKLDNIEADGQESIKQARKEAINCINKCIGVLEAKADAGNKQDMQPMNMDRIVPINNQTEHQQPRQPEQQSNNSRIENQLINK